MKKIISIIALTCFVFYSCKENNTTALPSQNVENWPWHDSLDALVAASDYHKLVYEDSSMRVLEVTVMPGKLDPIHTHKGKSIVWVTHSSPLLYKTYEMDSNNNWTLVKTDTIIVKPEELNKAVWEKPEPPHSVENIGKEIFKLYRIEYKTND